MRHIASIKCSSVVAQLVLGYYDQDGNLVGEETFPQVEGNVLTAKLFHPHAEQLATLIQTCIEQAWAKLGAQGRGGHPMPGSDDALEDGQMAEFVAEDGRVPR
jgi:hypothetical protein